MAPVYQAYALSEEMEYTDLGMLGLNYLWSYIEGSPDAEKARGLVQEMEDWASSSGEYPPTALLRPAVSAISGIMNAVGYTVDGSQDRISRCVWCAYNTVFNYLEHVAHRFDGKFYAGRDLVGSLPIVQYELTVQSRHLIVCEQVEELTPDLLKALRHDAYYEGGLSPFARLLVPERYAEPYFMDMWTEEGKSPLKPLMEDLGLEY